MFLWLNFLQENVRLKIDGFFRPTKDTNNYKLWVEASSFSWPACSFQESLLVSRQDMTNYHLTPPTIFPSLTVQEAKEKRRQVLAAVRHRRKIIYQRFQKKMQLQASNTLATIA